MWNDSYLGYSWNIIGNILSSLGSLLSNHILRISRTILICKNLGDFGMMLLEYSWWEKFSSRGTFILHKEVQSLLFIYCNWQDFCLDLKIEEFAWYKLVHSKMSLDILYNVMWVLAEQRYPLCHFQVLQLKQAERKTKFSWLCWRITFWELSLSLKWQLLLLSHFSRVQLCVTP